MAVSYGCAKGYSGGHVDVCGETQMLGDSGQNQRTKKRREP